MLIYLFLISRRGFCLFLFQSRSIDRKEHTLEMLATTGKY